MSDKDKKKLDIDVLRTIHAVNDTNILFRDTNILVGNKAKTGILNYKGEPLFDQTFAILDLTKFIDAIQIFEKSELSFAKDHVLIKDGSSKKTMRYSFAGKAIMDKLSAEILNDNASPKTFMEDAKKAVKKGSYFKFKFGADLIKEITGVGSKFGFRELLIKYNPDNRKIVFEVMNISVKGDKYTIENLAFKDSNMENSFVESIYLNNLLGGIDFDCYCFDDKRYMFLVSEDGKYEYIISYNSVKHEEDKTEDAKEAEIEVDDNEGDDAGEADEKPVKKKFKVKIRKK